MPCICGNLYCDCRLLCHCDESKCNCYQCDIIDSRICKICNKHLHHDRLNVAGGTNVDRCTCFTFNPSIIGTTSGTQEKLTDQITVGLAEAKYNRNNPNMDEIREVDNDFEKIGQTISELKKELEIMTHDVTSSTQEGSVINETLAAKLNHFASKIDELLPRVQGIVDKTQKFIDKFAVFQVLQPKAKELQNEVQQLQQVARQILGKLDC